MPVDKIVSNLTIALFGSLAAAWVLSRVLPKTPVYQSLVSHSASGEASVAVQEQEQSKQIGELGVATSVLRPGGKARFGDQIIDVISQGEMISKGSRVRVIGHSGKEAIVETRDFVATVIFARADSPAHRLEVLDSSGHPFDLQISFHRLAVGRCQICRGRAS